MNRKFFIMALIRGIFGYFPCGFELPAVFVAYNIQSKRFFNWRYILPYWGIGALLHKTLLIIRLVAIDKANIAL
ncbi:hypothetical protein [Paenibacillus polymyxa]|uniref:hypothetical protein n=1 Tax=Paenibacillus polymyxa TaxID=1406 RepID=UPI002378B9CB|nr:hypothetical protein [Paenibacillus polymyxa]WDM24556.1 hypothetical protein J4I02_08215 [Paenibacillus polymyxa]